MSASTVEEVDDDEFDSQLQAIARLDATIERISKRAQLMNNSDQTKHDDGERSGANGADSDGTFLTSFGVNASGNATSNSSVSGSASADVERIIAETLERAQTAADDSDENSTAAESHSETVEPINGFSFTADDADRLSEISRLIVDLNAKSKRTIVAIKRQQKHSKTPHRTPSRNVKLPRIDCLTHSVCAATKSSPLVSYVDDDLTDKEYRDKLKSLEQQLQTLRDADDEKDDECSDPRFMYNKVLALTEMNYSPYMKAAAPSINRQGNDSDDEREWTVDDERQAEIDSVIPDSDDDDGGKDRVVLKVSALGSKIERMLAEMDATAVAAGITPNRSPLPERTATGEAALANRSRRLSEPELLRAASAGAKAVSIGRKSTAEISSNAHNVRSG